MLTLLLQASPESMPGWVGPTLALSAVAVALVMVIFLIGVAIAGRALQDAVDGMSGNFAELHRDLAEVLEGARRVATEGEALVELVREEGEAYVKTSRRFRRRLDRGIDQVSERAADLEALYDVVQEEVEESALRLASTLRTARLSTSIIAKALRRRRRR